MTLHYWRIVRLLSTGFSPSLNLWGETFREEEVFMVVMIHQAHLLPWLGYFNKLANADCFIIQDNVQFRRRYYQNRTDIRDMHGESYKLSLPVHAKRETLIKDVEISCDQHHLKKFLKTVEHSYSKTPFFDVYWTALRDALNSSNKLIEVNINCILTILSFLDLEIRIEFASQYSKEEDSTDSLIQICKAVGASYYLVGEGNSKTIHEEKKFLQHNIKIIRQNFKCSHPVYNQKGHDFLYGLSIIDTLFNIGNLETRRLITNAWKIEI